ncbi:MAG: hypothetical protein ACKVQS_06720 [Fimbriimonadaceae bacterium]
MKHLVVLNLLVFPLFACSPQPLVKASDLETQTKLARAEGLCVTPDDLRAKFKPLAKDQNAAPILKELSAERLLTQGHSVEQMRMFNSTAEEDIKKSEAVLNNCAPQLAQIVKAAELPGCFFNRRWEDGYSLLYDEYSQAKAGSQLLAARAFQNARTGNHKASITDLNRMVCLANHISEPFVIAELAQVAIYTMTWKSAARLAYRYPQEVLYTAFLKETLDGWPDQNFKSSVGNELTFLLSLYEDCKTRQLAKEKQGMSDESLKGLKDAVPEPQFSQAKAKLIHLYRDVVKAYDLPQEQAYDKLAVIEDQIYDVLKACPIAQEIFQSIRPIFPTNSDAQYIVERQKMLLTVAYRVLSEGSPDSIVTDDLTSSITGEKIRYTKSRNGFLVEVISSDQKRILMSAQIQ